MKTCTRCKTSKTLTEMARQKGSLDGYSSWCKGCYRDAHRSRNLVRARAKMQQLHEMKSGPCTDCGRRFDPCCMDFDHVRGVKRNGVSRLLTCSDMVIQAEVEKCDLVCAVCHRLRTHNRGSSNSTRYQAFANKLAALKSPPCVDCGQSYLPPAMDFDHVKEFTIAQMSTCAWDRVLREIAKCDLVCAVCHRLRTVQRKRAA